jgi:hypothetical protein
MVLEYLALFCTAVQNIRLTFGTAAAKTAANPGISPAKGARLLVVKSKK